MHRGVQSLEDYGGTARGDHEHSVALPGNLIVEVDAHHIVRADLRSALAELRVAIPVCLQRRLSERCACALAFERLACASAALADFAALYRSRLSAGQVFAASQEAEHRGHPAFLHVCIE